jgi:hypothetical protein
VQTTSVWEQLCNRESGCFSNCCLDIVTGHQVRSSTHMDDYRVNQDLTHRVPDNSLVAMRMKKFRNESDNAA